MKVYLVKRFCIIKFIMTLSAVFILSACGGGETTIPAPPPLTINLTITAAENLNPDLENRASPIVIRIYQLTHIDTFDNSDFFALYENDQNLLAKELKFREELEIKPNQSSIKTFDLSSGSKYIAVLAAFRDLDNAQWKSFLLIDPLIDRSIDPLNLQPLKIEVGKSTITIKPST